jgi:2-(1,2-epoxy-1,2-dihydrophenyl)acetyl-CoA isomerase
MDDQEDSHCLDVAVDAGVATITLARPDALNALNMELKRALAAAIRQVGSDASVRCVVLTGRGRAFCAGGDIAEMRLNDNPVRSRDRLQALLRDVVLPLAELEKPTIAAINGHAHGAGLSLMLACDLAIASVDATMSCAFSKLGLLPDCGALWFLPRRVPMPVAKDLIFTGRRISADEGMKLGLVNEVVPAAELADAVGTLAAKLASAPTVALGLTKRLLDRSLESTLHEMAALESMAQAILYSTQDHLAAQEAFVNKTPARFVGA